MKKSASPSARYVTQKNVEAVYGLSPAQFLEAIRTYRLPHSAIGKMRLVDVEVFDQWVSAHTGVRKPTHDLTEEQESAALAQRLGLRRAG